jgi:hypothetical protein
MNEAGTGQQVAQFPHSQMVLMMLTSPFCKAVQDVTICLVDVIYL